MFVVGRCDWSHSRPPSLFHFTRAESRKLRVRLSLSPNPINAQPQPYLSTLPALQSPKPPPYFRSSTVKSKNASLTLCYAIRLRTLILTLPTVLEARLEQADLLKKVSNSRTVVQLRRTLTCEQVVDAIKDLVQDCNFDCNDSGIALQAMDNSHVALVSMMLKAESFSPYRCDRNVALGVNLTSLTKVLRAAQNEDILTIKAEDAPDVLNLVFESSDNDRLSEYDLKLMDIDQEHLGIPDTEYAATISMPSAEFKRICVDLMALSESGTSDRPS